ncbi:uncharacterized protein LY89DRAFT_731665 [Mollisia scopiformis]|uniref:DUF6594 domain-containing protein n=1 Tax=Mollisia scopiformis TaxID=149040 RepID=A0A194XHK4_MOLSC|nr:uncharacterized protein LY89DRAFT_731665 [Mollisia scopiformis]KUJ19257.1 hypothetical protein LY89DRAFT_731665 [Mollisia scopiformis]
MNERINTSSVGENGLQESDIEKAVLASSGSWSSTILDSSASARSDTIQKDQRQGLESSENTRLCSVPGSNTHGNLRQKINIIDCIGSLPPPYCFLLIPNDNSSSVEELTQREEGRAEESPRAILSSPNPAPYVVPGRLFLEKASNQHPASIEEYPAGWPQLAAFLHSEDNFAIFRRFGMTHCRVLVQLQAEIQLLEQELTNLDSEDAKHPDRTWRLQMADIEENRDLSDAAQKILLKKLQEKLLVYDQLLLNDQKLREIGHAKQNDHLSVYHWICREKPLGAGQYNWIFHATDFVPLSKTDQFEYSILNSFLKRLFLSPKSNGTIDHYSKSAVTTFTKLISVLFAVAILVVPIFILLWIPETRAWISATVLISVFVFSALMTLFSGARVQEILVGTAAYCAVSATFLGNTQTSSGVR